MRPFITFRRTAMTPVRWSARGTRYANALKRWQAYRATHQNAMTTGNGHAFEVHVKFYGSARKRE
jgi:hypothetical protein